MILGFSITKGIIRFWNRRSIESKIREWRRKYEKIRRKKEKYYVFGVAYNN